MNTKRKDLVYAHIAGWEYGCCGTVPSVGARYEGQLYGFPSERETRFSPKVDRWEPELQLIWMGDLAAGFDDDLPDWESFDWARGYDPIHQPIMLNLTWHDLGPAMNPHVTAEVVEVYEASVQCELRDGAWHPIAGTEQYRAVETTPQHGPKDLNHDEETGRGFDGVIVGLRITNKTLPTEEERARWEASRERGSRSLALTGPATLFGETVPALGERRTIDVSQPGFSRIEGEAAKHITKPRPLSGKVVQQVSTVHPRPEGGGSFEPAKPGTPTAEFA